MIQRMVIGMGLIGIHPLLLVAGLKHNLQCLSQVLMDFLHLLFVPELFNKFSEFQWCKAPVENLILFSEESVFTLQFVRELGKVLCREHGGSFFASGDFIDGIITAYSLVDDSLCGYQLRLQASITIWRLEVRVYLLRALLLLHYGCWSSCLIPAYVASFLCSNTCYSISEWLLNKVLTSESIIIWLEHHIVLVLSELSQIILSSVQLRILEFRSPSVSVFDSDSPSELLLDAGDILSGVGSLLTFLSQLLLVIVKGELSHLDKILGIEMGALMLMLLWCGMMCLSMVHFLNLIHINDLAVIWCHIACVLRFFKRLFSALIHDIHVRSIHS